MGSPSGPLQSNKKVNQTFMHIYNKYEQGKHKTTFCYYKSLSVAKKKKAIGTEYQLFKDIYIYMKTHLHQVMWLNCIAKS